MNKIFLAVALFATLLITAGCATANTDKQDIGIPSTQEISITNADEFNQNQHIQKQVEVAKGGQIIITLISNASTGFSWNENATIADTSILEQLKHEDIAATSNQPGAAGEEQWTFKALKAGMTSIHLEYSRPWEGGEKGVWTLDVSVTVK